MAAKTFLRERVDAVFARVGPSVLGLDWLCARSWQSPRFARERWWHHTRSNTVCRARGLSRKRDKRSAVLFDANAILLIWVLQTILNAAIYFGVGILVGRLFLAVKR